MTGLNINGVTVPQEIVDRVENLVSEEARISGSVAHDIRIEGMSDALAGNWTLNRLDGYLSEVEALSPDIEELVRKAATSMEESGVAPDHARNTVRNLAISVLSGQSDQVTYDLNREISRETGMNDESPKANYLTDLRDMVQGVSQRVDEMNAIGKIDPDIMSRITEERVASFLSEERPGNEKVAAHSGPGVEDEPGL